MANTEDSLIREVKEELEREKYEKLWADYGTFIIGGAVAFVAAVGGYTYWTASAQANVEAAGASYETALSLSEADGASDADREKAVQTFEELTKTGPVGYQALSQLQLAGLLLNDGKRDEALGAFEALAKKSSADPILRDYAGLQAATLRVGDADWTEIENRLNPLAGETAPWRYSAMQLLGAAAFKAGKLAKAREVFNTLSGDPKVPSGIRERASLYLSRIVARELAANVQSEPAQTSAGAGGDGSVNSKASTGDTGGETLTSGDAPKTATDEKTKP